ncbi:MAG TPA: fatty acid desaturase [Polyangiaceae bacterium]|nr:fatty acid desaturase [Polyangiaceae bacterium]
MLRYRADVRTLAFVTFYYVLVTAEWRLAPWRWYVVVPLVALTCVVSWICAVITHNTLHSPVFKSRNANKLFQLALTCAYGFPVSEYVPGHNLSHHKFTQKRADLMRTSKARQGWNLLNLFVFFPRVGLDIFSENYRYAGMMKQKLPRWYQQLIIEMIVCWGSKAALLLLDWRKALVFIVVPHLYAVWGITTVNFVQHDGCDEDDEYNHSRNFVGKIFNWFTFNNGFHGIHHEHPGLHWSLCREAHYAELHEGIHPALEQKSLAVYVFKTFVYPGKRLRYDDKPVVLPEDGPDAEWIPGNIQAAVQELGAEGTAMDAG